MPDSIKLLLLRAKLCPFACLLKILFLLLFCSALYIALFYQYSMSPYLFSGFVAMIAFIAMLALAMNRNCRLRINENDEDPVAPLSG